MTSVALWYNLGTVSPTFNDWVTFPVQSLGGTIFKIRFNGIENWEQFFKTFIVIRPVHLIADEVLVGKGSRFWPNRDTPEIEYRCPLPEELLVQARTIRQFQIKRFWCRRYIGRSGEPNYSITLFDYRFDQTNSEIIFDGEYFEDGSFIQGGRLQYGGPY